MPWEVTVWLFPDLRLILRKQSPSSVFLLAGSCDQKRTCRTLSRAPNLKCTIYHRYCRPTPGHLNPVNKVVAWLAGLRMSPVMPMKT